jgi:glucose-1-phosphate thymidylyltransferase
MQGELHAAGELDDGGLIFGYPVRDPERYGVVEFRPDGTVVGIEEKPRKPKSHYAVPGLYFFGPDVADIAATLKPSPRGELEITDLNLAYLKEGRLRVRILGRGLAWLDTGTYDSLAQATIFVQTIQERQGLKVGCVEEIAFRLQYIDAAQLHRLGEEMSKNEYGQYLIRVAGEER